MYYVYVLKSKSDNKLYIGFTSDMRKRLEEHNAGENLSTRGRRPFQLVYCEVYKSRKDALTREKKLKNFKNSYKELKKRILNSLNSI
ncbi:MAG: GIY-YIG nuclease family protein [Patescibacteria group bacterium]